MTTERPIDASGQPIVKSAPAGTAPDVGEWAPLLDAVAEFVRRERVARQTDVAMLRAEIETLRVAISELAVARKRSAPRKVSPPNLRAVTG